MHRPPVVICRVDNVVGHESALLNIRLGINRRKVVAVVGNQRIIPKDYRVVECLLVVLDLSSGVYVRPAVGPERKQELYQRIISLEKVLSGNPAGFVPVFPGERIGEDLRIWFHVVGDHALILAGKHGRVSNRTAASKQIIQRIGRWKVLHDFLRYAGFGALVR